MISSEFEREATSSEREVTYLVQQYGAAAAAAAAAADILR